MLIGLQVARIISNEVHISANIKKHLDTVMLSKHKLIDHGATVESTGI